MILFDFLPAGSNFTIVITHRLVNVFGQKSENFIKKGVVQCGSF